MSPSTLRALLLASAVALVLPALGACGPGASEGVAVEDEQEIRSGVWVRVHVPARATVRRRIDVSRGVHRITWTDHYGVRAGQRRPAPTLDVVVRDRHGRALTGVIHNSARNDNGLEPDPVDVEAETPGLVVELREIKGRGGDIELRVDRSRSGPSPAPLAPPAGLVVHEAGQTSSDGAANPDGAVLLAGGGRDHDGAMRALVESGSRGDAVVLRMDDTGGAYASYLVELGARSARELVFDAPRGNTDVGAAELADIRRRADDGWVEQTIDRAEILLIAGGNQTKYVDAWAGTRLAAAVDRLVGRRGAIGGTSAGMHVLAGVVHTPRGPGSSVTSNAALADPYIGRGEQPGTASLELEPSPFAVPLLGDVVADTHWSERGRLGRTLVFLARVIADGIHTVGDARAIACDEGVAVVVDHRGRARVFGPSGASRAATFLRPDAAPVRCIDGASVDWPAGVPFVRVEGTPDGRRVFDFATWSDPAGAPVPRAVVNDGVVTITP
jgi:cyanophycinase